MSFARTHPFLSALMLGAVTCGALYGTQGLVVRRLEVANLGKAPAPVLDGDTSDAAWRRARPVTVLTAHGGDFGGGGESRVRVRALHDDRYLYMAIVWEDPTRSLDLRPLVKAEGHWHEQGAAAQGTPLFDDRLAIMLSPPGRALIGAAIHLGKRPLADAPAPQSGRGLHYTGPGGAIEIWQWHAALGRATGRAETLRLGPPLPATPAQRAGQARYLGGVEVPAPLASLNHAAQEGSHCGAVLPLRLPRFDPSEVTDIETVSAAAPDPDATPPTPRPAVLTRGDSTPFSPLADARIPDGTVIPGLVLDRTGAPGPQDIEARGKWDGGYWVLELRRPLAGRPPGLSVRTGMMMWFAAFDHARTRHSYHLRPLILEMRK